MCAVEETKWVSNGGPKKHNFWTIDEKSDAPGSEGDSDKMVHGDPKRVDNVNHEYPAGYLSQVRKLKPL